MKEVQQITLIQTTIATRGDGESTPIRHITQWWTQTGELVAENDPCAVVVTEEQRRELTSIIGSLGLSSEKFGNAIERVARVLGRQNDQSLATAGAGLSKP